MSLNVVLPSEPELRVALDLIDRLARTYVMFAHDKDPADEDDFSHLIAHSLLEDNETCDPEKDHQGFHEQVSAHARRRILGSFGSMQSAQQHRTSDSVLQNAMGDRLLLQDASRSMRAMADILAHARLLAWDESERLLQDSSDLLPA